MIKKLSLIVFLATSFVAYSQIPSYYNDVNLNLTGTALRDALATKVINSHTTILSYGWTNIQLTDLDPTNSSNVLLIYGTDDSDGNYVTDKTRSVNSNGGTAGIHWNREHTYPKSLGNPNLGTSGPGADVHHLRASDVTMNSDRGSLKFEAGSGNPGVSGTGWYPGDEWKGDVARMMMYMYLRYGSRCYPSGVANGTTNSVDSNMIDLLLDWNAEDPVSEYEINRNTILETAQGNRNPFIDNPAFATTIWGGAQAEDLFSAAAADCTDLFISEYIEGSGNNKFLEIYNPTGSSIDLTTYDVVIYQNGSATVTSTLSLSGTIASGATFVIENSSESLSYTADLSTSSSVMQFNGDDAIALRKSSAIIDVIGQIGTDPGTQWTGAVCTIGTEGAVLRRNSSVKSGDTDGSDAFDPDGEWTCSSTDDTSNLGTFSNACFSPEINIQGNSVSIVDGATATSATDDTDYGDVATSSGTTSKIYTIQNLGNSTLTLSGIPTISTGDAADFSITANPSLTIAALGSTTFEVTFDPSADGTRTTTITVSSDDSDEGTYTFDISGTGTSGGSSCGSELFISEYIEGTGNNKFIEIYNPSGSSINLSTYDLVSYTNGSSSVSNTLTLSGTIASEGTFIIENSSESLAVSADLSTTNSVMQFNGDDVVALRKSGVIVDVIGQIGTDPGTQWAGTCGAQNITLIRNASVVAGDTDGSNAFTTDTEWSCTTVNDVSNLGSHVISCSSGTPEINVLGNSVSIASGTTDVTTTNDTFFGAVSTSSATIVKTFTIQNTGDGTLTLSGNPVISTGDAADFTVTSNPSLTISASSSTTFQVTFDPSADSVRTTTITISSDDADEGTYTFNISGKGNTAAVPCASVIGGTLFQQDFESSPATPTLTYTSSGTSVSSGNGNTPSDPMYSGGSQGIQVNNSTSTVEFATINSLLYTNLEFSIRLASFSGTSGNGHDASDYVKVFVSTDGGSNYSEEININGGSTSSSNNRWSFTSGTGEASVSYDGDDTATSFTPSGSGNLTTEGISTLKITSLPASATLRIKIELNNTSSNEFWVLDDALIIGDVESIATWTGSWSGSTPANDVKVVIDGDLDLSAISNLASCEIEVKSGSTLTVSAGMFIKIENNVINDGAIIIEDSGSLLQVSDVGNITGSGTFTARRNTTSLASRFVFTYWTSPLLSSTLSEIASDASQYYYFNANTQAWVATNSAQAVIPGVAYAVQGPNAGTSYPGTYTAEFTGSSFNNGDISVALGYTDDGSADNDWNLIGNPYPSTLNATKFLETNPDIGGTIYFWTHNTDASSSQTFSQDDYVSWNATGGTAGCDGCIAPTSNIASGQGFFAQALASSTSVKFTNDMRVGPNNDNFYINVNPNDQNKIWVNFSSATSFNQILIGFLDDATDGIDRLYDGPKLDGGTNANLYSIIDQKPFAIQGRSSLSAVEVIPLGVELNVSEDFTISIDHIEGNLQDSNIFLRDNALNVLHDLKSGPYTFAMAETGIYEHIFELVIESTVLNTEEETIEESIPTNLTIESYTNSLAIRTVDGSIIEKVAVYNLLGQEIAIQGNSENFIILKSPSLNTSSILIVKTQLENGEVIINKILKN